MEVVAIDLDVSANWELSWSNELHALVDVLILLSGKEWSFDDTRILLSWLKNRDGVVSQIERNDEPSVDILWDFSVESGSESQNLLIVIDVLEEINLWLLWNKIIDITEGVDFVSETVVWWNLDNDGISWLNWHDVTQWEVLSISLEVIVLGEFVDTLDLEASAISYQVSFEINLITSQIMIANELLSWLIHIESLWQLLSSKINGEGISSIIWEMAFSDLNSIVSQEIVPHELKVLTDGEESQNFSIVVQELLLGSNSSSSELLFEEFKKFLILLWWNWSLFLNECVLWALASLGLGLANIL